MEPRQEHTSSSACTLGTLLLMSAGPWCPSRQASSGSPPVMSHMASPCKGVLCISTPPPPEDPYPQRVHLANVGQAPTTDLLASRIRSDEQLEPSALRALRAPKGDRDTPNTCRYPCWSVEEHRLKVDTSITKFTTLGKGMLPFRPVFSSVKQE